MRYFTIAALAAALLIPSAAYAQRGGGGHGGGGGGHGGGGVSHSGGGGTWHGGGGSWGGGGHGGDGWGGRGYYWYPGLAFGLGYGLGAYGWGYGWPDYYGYYGSPGYSYYSYPSYYSYDYPSTTNYDSYPRTSSYYDPLAGSSDNSMSPNRARLEIMVPDPNAELIIEGQRMNAMGRMRVFSSPDLEPGRAYSYTITLRHNVAGRTEDDTRTIDVRAGANAKVDFSQPQVHSLPAPRSNGDRIPPVSKPPQPAVPPRD